MALTDAEVESLRFHLGYGNLDYGAYPYTPDGFKEIFDQVIGPNLTGTTETTASTAITAGSTVTVTPVSMTGIVVHARLVIDVADAVEIVSVRAVTLTTFTAAFANAHTGTYPVALLGGTARLRMLLAQADKAWQSIQDTTVATTSGLKSVDKGDVVWKDDGSADTLKTRRKVYQDIVASISSLVRVEPRWAGDSTGRLEAY